jgi:hypothetical protein
MTKRNIGWTAVLILVMATTAQAQEPLPAQTLTVCLTFSEAPEIDAPLRTAVLTEVKRIWGRMGVTVGMREESGKTCDRFILVKSSLEAGPEDATGETAIAWVPFAGKRARQVVFVRVNRARLLIEEFHPTIGIRPPALAELLVAKLLGRSLAHELGHVLLNSLEHERSGLMRARYEAHDALRDVASEYTLNARQLDRLLARR